MPNVFINPTYQGPDRADGGIRRVSDAQNLFLPSFGWTCQYSPDDVDVIANHGTALAERPDTSLVAHCHGLYWHDYEWPLWSEDANRRVMETIVRADAVTAPSQWVAQAIARGTLRKPSVIYHGVDTDAWAPPEDGSRPYVLWNKARVDAVSSPDDMQKLAEMVPHIRFVSTFGQETSNVKIIGKTDYERQKGLVQHARVYLATVRETFGISTLEALASGVPVVGWDYGGQSEIIRQEETGILVSRGDFGMLASALQTVWNERDRYSRAAREDTLARWQWRDKVEQYAHLYDEIYRQTTVHRPDVSIIVTCYNLAKYLDDCLRSVRGQALRNWECIIIDDCSTDATESIAREWEKQGGFRYVKTSENVGLSGARNIGFAESRGKYILFLDADDMLDRATSQELVDALNADKGVHIVYGSLDMVDESGQSRKRNPWPPGAFDWRSQIAHLNQLPYAAIMRRSVFESTGGYRTRDWRAEDASFWVRATSHGFRAARVTDRPCVVYRNRSDSKSGRERNQFRDADGDWTSWFPWRLGASSGEEGTKLVQGSRQPTPLLVPFGAQGDPPAPHLSWPIHHYANPTVSVIIPVGPGHEKNVINALDSLVAQTFPEWEVIVVDDTGRNLEVPGHPYAHIVRTKVGGSGAGRARNLGIKASRAPLLFFLDADDWIRFDTLEKMVEAYAKEGGYIYSDCVALEDNAISKQYTSCGGRGWATFSDERTDEAIWRIEAVPYDRRDFLSRGYDESRRGAHSVSILVAKVDMLKVGGFNEGMAFWEDWAAGLALAREGICGRHIMEPLLSYVWTTGRRRKASRDIEEELRRILREEFEDAAKEADEMCNCGGGGPSLQQQAADALSPYKTAQASMAGRGAPQGLPGQDASPGFREMEKVALRYVGRKSAPVPYVGKVTGTVYRACKDPLHEIIQVEPPDVDHLLSTREFAILTPTVKSETVKW